MHIHLANFKLYNTSGTVYMYIIRNKKQQNNKLNIFSYKICRLYIQQKRDVD